MVYTKPTVEPLYGTDSIKDREQSLVAIILFPVVAPFPPVVYYVEVAVEVGYIQD